MIHTHTHAHQHRDKLTNKKNAPKEMKKNLIYFYVLNELDLGAVRARRRGGSGGGGHYRPGGW